MTTNHHGDSCDDSATRWNDAETITLHLVVFRQQLQNWFMDHKLAMCPTTTRVSIPLIDRFAVVLVPRKEKEQHDQHAQMTKRLVSAIRLNPLRCFKITRIEKTRCVPKKYQIDNYLKKRTWTSEVRGLQPQDYSNLQSSEISNYFNESSVFYLKEPQHLSMFWSITKPPTLQTFRVFCKFPTFQKLSQNTVLQRSSVPLGLPGGFAVPKAEPRGGVRSDLDGDATYFLTDNQHPDHIYIYIHIPYIKCILCILCVTCIICKICITNWEQTISWWMSKATAQASYWDGYHQEMCTRILIYFWVTCGWYIYI